MIVWLLTAHWEYEGSISIGCFSSREKALAWTKRLGFQARDYVMLSCETLDDPLNVECADIDSEEVWHK